jgi:hypothetical protein
VQRAQTGTTKDTHRNPGITFESCIFAAVLGSACHVCHEMDTEVHSGQQCC